MSYSKLRVGVVACGLAAALLLAPSPSEGGLCDWLFPAASPAPVATTYAPPYTAQRVSLMPVVSTSYSACSPCSYTACSPCSYTACSPVGQTCYYAPQTAYRWSYSRVERTSYRPVTALDPCTGCPTTTYQAVTRRSLLPWLHRKPVTTYQMVCSPTCATTVCSPVCSTVCGPTCSSCCGVPSISGSVIGSSVGSSCPSGCVPATTIPGSGSSAPRLDPGYVPPSGTFKTEQGTGTSGASAEGTRGATSRYQPSSDLQRTPSTTEPPALIHPDNRTAAKPIHHYATYRQVTEVPAAGAAPASTLDVGGWRASRD